MADPTPAADLDVTELPPAPPVARKYDRSIVEGPLPSAVWKIAWPTMIQNIIGGLQGIIDHIMVGHYVGFAGNAAIGVSWQIFLVVIVFISSLFTGMSVLVSRFAGAGAVDKVDRTVYQAFLTAVMISLVIMAPVGYFASPWLLDLVNAAPAVKAQALPFLRIMFSFSTGMLIFFMLGVALRSAGDARTPMVLGIVMTALNIGLNVILIRGHGTDPRVRHHGRGDRHVHVELARRAVRAVQAMDGRLGGVIPAEERLRARLGHHPVALPVRIAHRHPGDRDEHRRRVHAVVHRFARAERRVSGGVRGVVLGAVLARDVDLRRD